METDRDEIKFDNFYWWFMKDKSEWELIERISLILMLIYEKKYQSHEEIPNSCADWFFIFSLLVVLCFRLFLNWVL